MNHSSPSARPRQTSYVFCTGGNNSSNSSNSDDHDSRSHANSTRSGPRNVNGERDSGREILIRTTQAPRALQDASGSPLQPPPWEVSQPPCSRMAHPI
ncbi:unnamed protein product, partial [Laminaria digitata]